MQAMEYGKAGSAGERTAAYSAKWGQEMGRLVRILIVMALGWHTLAVAQPANESAALILHNGNGLTMTAEDARVSAIAVTGGRILAVGTDAEILAYRTDESEVVDLDGRTFIPGFIDAHGHFSGVAQFAFLANLSPPPVGPATSVATLQQTLSAYIDASSPEAGSWVVGYGYDDGLLDELRHPTRQDLDAVSTSHPIMIVHVSGHLAVMNSRALEMAGITSATPDPDGGIIRRESDGSAPNGVLEEVAFFVAAASIGQPSLEEQIASLLRAQEIHAANGITTAQDAAMRPNQVPALQAAAAQGLLAIDVVGLVLGGTDWGAFDSSVIGAEYNGHFRVGGIKLLLDGSPQGRTAWLNDPVPVPPQGQDAGYSGYQQVPDEQLATYLAQALANDWQVFAHVNGDAAAQQLIDAVSVSGIAPEARTIAIHNQVVTPAQLEQMHLLGIHPTYFVAHTFYWGDWHREVSLGIERADFMSPLRAALDAGLVPTIHNDAPIVPPDMPMLLWTAVERRSRSGDIMGPGQRVSAYEALEMVTRNAAWQIGEEDSKGMLRPGSADITILTADPTAVESPEIRSIDVVATIKDGAFIFGSAESLSE
jgi:predicted amidohydrolase YtcJ